ncbi:MAG: DUF481 domain-containing protein [Gemmatimonadota bacterium]|nr:MAG: DUF481 domain-containing protein [Gemmatimonadota bacterium]
MKPVVAFGVLTLVMASIANAQQDTVILRSGNPVLGEVEYLRRGSLALDTEEMDVVQIDWEEIALLTSRSFHEVILVSGEKYFGSLVSADTGVLVIAGAARSDTVPFSQVVQIEPIETSFWARTNGFIDIGSNITRANSLKSILIKGRIDYRGTKWGGNLRGEAYGQRQQSVSAEGDTTTQTTSRASASLSVNRFLGGVWSVVGQGDVEQNQELELDLRLLGVLAGAYQIIRNQGIEFSVGAGLAGNHEQFVGEQDNNSVEAIVGAGFDAFDAGDIAIFTSLLTYSNPFEDGGRFRVNFDGRVAWDVFGDFTLGLNITERFDSNPPSATASKRDYQYNLSVGWSW